MITLYQFAPAFGLPNASPFCMKLETYLRMAGLSFEIAPRVNIRRAPKGKLPYIEDNGRRIGDSSLIIDYLKATYGDPLDGALSAQDRAVALAFRRLMEENLYWAVLHGRWVEPEGWAATREAFFSRLPVLLRWFLPGMVRRMLIRELHGHGMGRHRPEEIQAIGCADVTALADFLGDKPFFMGEHPTSLDAVGYAFLANILWAPLDSALRRHARKYPQFEAYCQRMKGRYYS
jgi:glutathione S-transferase